MRILRLLAFLILSSLFLAQLPAQAQAPSPLPITDILFVVDQSGSMTEGSLSNPQCRANSRAPGCRSNPTDPAGLSLDAVRNGLDPLFSRLVAQRLANFTQNAEKEEYQVGLIFFGTKAASVIPLTRLEAITDPQTHFLTPNIVNQLPKTQKNYGDTSFSQALSQVCLELGNNSTCTKPFPPNRRRVVILLTDGNPAVQNEPNALENAYTAQNPSRYFELLRATYANLFNNAEIWVIGIDKQDQFWSTNVAEWEKIAPTRTRRVTDPADVTLTFQDIADKTFFAETIAANTCDPATKFAVLPYLASVTLVLNYRDSESKAAFYPPSENAKPEAERIPLSPQSPGVISYNRSKLSEFFIIQRPEAGNWSCKLLGPGIKPEYRKRDGLVAIAETELTPKEAVLSTCKPFHFTVKYKDNERKSLEELADYPIFLRATVQLNNGQSQILDLRRSENQKGQWETIKPLQPDTQGGTYTVTIDLRLTANDKTSFFSSQSLLTVSPAYPCQFVVTKPKTAEKQIISTAYWPWPWKGWCPAVPPEKVLPVESSFQLVRSDAKPLDSTLFALPFTEALSLSVLLPDGQRIKPSKIERKDSNSSFSAAFEKLDQAATYTLSLELNAPTKAGQLYQIPVSNIVFERVLHSTVLLICRLEIGLVLLFFLFCSGILLWFGYLILPPYPSGMLILQTRQKTPPGLPPFPTEEWQTRNLNLAGYKLLGFRTKHPHLGKRELPSSLGLKRIEIRRLAEREGLLLKIISQKGLVSEKRLNHDGAILNLSSDVRLKYENFAARTKR